jgi:hypothetical protein
MLPSPAGMFVDRDQSTHAKLSLADLDTGLHAFFVLTACAALLGQFCALCEFLVKTKRALDGGT